MFRVVTRYTDHRRNRILEAGPWHVSRNEAENWADILRGLGYYVYVETAEGKLAAPRPDTSLQDALSSMA